MPRVVIADDHVVVRDGLRRILEANGHEIVAEIGDGLEVVESVERLRPDVLLLDLGMPGLHGLDVLRKLAARKGSTGVLVLSAESRDEMVISALKSGAKGYLLKSCSGKELLAAVSAVAQGGHYVSTELSDVLVRGISDGGAKAPDPYDALSDREREVFHAMAEGLSNAAIGERLFISPRTAETHRAKIIRRLGLKSQTDIVLYALRRGVITLDS
jgi:two-component system response regulator NreC